MECLKLLCTVVDVVAVFAELVQRYAENVHASQAVVSEALDKH